MRGASSIRRSPWGRSSRGVAVSIAVATAALGVSASLAGGASPRVAVWTVTDLGSLGGAESSATAIDARGRIVGGSDTVDGPRHAFLWVAGRMTDLGTLGGRASTATAINDAGLVVGASDTRLRGARHAFSWRAGTMRDLGTLGGPRSRANDVSSSGDVVGWSEMPGSGRAHATLWSGGRLRDLGTLGGASSIATGINDRGQVVGISELAGGEPRLFLWQRGQMIDLGPRAAPAPECCRGRWWLAPRSVPGINDRGEIIGQRRFKGFVLHGKELTWLPIGDADYGGPSAINERGLITGSRGRPMNFDAVVWHGTQMTNLPSLPGAWSSANGVNDRGQVVGESVYVVVAHEVDAHSTDVESLWHAALWTRT